MSERPIRLVFVDDHVPLLSAWTRLIEKQPDMAMVATRSDADNLASVLIEGKANALIIDLSAAGENPTRFIADITTKCPAVKVLVYSGQSAIEWAGPAKASGAAEYIDKATSPEEILATIRRVMNA